jgi:hypothetical protein
MLLKHKGFSLLEGHQMNQILSIFPYNLGPQRAKDSAFSIPNSLGAYFLLMTLILNHHVWVFIPKAELEHTFFLLGKVMFIIPQIICGILFT